MKQTSRQQRQRSIRERKIALPLNNLLQQHGCLPNLQEDKFSKGLEMFTNRLIPAPLQSQKRRHGSEDGSKNGSKNGNEEDSKNNSEDYSKPNNREIVDSSMNPDHEDC